VTNRAVGWYSSAERWFQTVVSIESFARYHGHEDITYYVLMTSQMRDLARIAIPDYVQIVSPEQTHEYYSKRLSPPPPHLGYNRCLIVEWMLSQGHERAMALDGDMETFAPLDDLWQVLETENAFVTPHRIYPPPRDGQMMFLEQFALCGNYNAGFTGFRNTPETRGFVEWWLRESVDNPECNMSAGRFAEQGWLRFIGEYLDRVHICRDQGVNFAFWRYDNHDQFRMNDGRYTVDGVPLKLFHYGALDFNDLGRVAIHHTRCRACPDLLAFFERYKALTLG
jgi:hypothetical protein